MDREYLLYYMQKNKFPKEAAEAFCRCLENIRRDPNLSTVLCQTVGAYEADQVQTWEDMQDLLARVGEAAEQSSEKPETVYLLFFILCTKHLKELYIQNEKPLRYFDGIAADMVSKLTECYKVRGIWGTFVANWYLAFFVLERFVIGRLQYDIRQLPDCVTPDGKYCFQRQTAVNVHIPSGKPLKMEDVHTSMQEAAEFFSYLFPQSDQVLFMCHSWLLFPGHYQMIPEESGIRQFMKEFTIIRVDISQEGVDLWRIFDTEDHSDPDRLPQNTSLQKAYAKWLQAGNPVGMGLGFRYLPKNREEISNANQ